MIREMRFSWRIFGCLAALFMAAGPRFAAAQPAPDVALSVYIAGLVFPVGFVNAGDGSGRNFVVTQKGKIFVYKGNLLLGTFLDASSIITCGAVNVPCGEQGLLGLAFHPNYASNGFFYIYYTDINGKEVIARYHVSGNANAADPTSETVLLRIPDPYPNHNGGQLEFGPDGYLYAGTGDGGSGGDPENRAQNPGELLGKILRIDVNGTGAIPCAQSVPAPYRIPDGNPFAGPTPGCAEVFHYGLRNPWRFSFDRLNHDLYIGDVGQSLYEEIDYLPAGTPGGVNFGWRRMEGFHCYDPAAACNDGTLTLPILEHDHTLGCSVTGGYVYRGALYPQLYGVYVYGDFCTGRIWGATRDAAGQWSKRVITFSQFISSFGEDEAGELYIVEHSGTVKKISSTTAYPVPVVTALNPIGSVKGDPSFELAVDGAGFLPASVVRWNGSDRTTTYVSRTRVIVTVPADDVASAGSATVAVSNPGPGGGLSLPRAFPITNLFIDVPVDHPMRRPIEGISAAGVTTGCGTRIFCPDGIVTRDQLAVLLLRAEHGSRYSPPEASGTIFGDVPAGAFAAAFIEQLFTEEATMGCGSGNYCPTAPVSRAPMTKFLLRALEGPTYVPPDPSGIFSDVPKSAPFAGWIDECSRRGITSGCGGGKFCPDATVTRAQMAAFLSRTFSIPLAP